MKKKKTRFTACSETQEQILNGREKLGVNSENSKQRFHQQLKPDFGRAKDMKFSKLLLVVLRFNFPTFYFCISFLLIHNLILGLYSNLTSLHVTDIAKANKRLALSTLYRLTCHKRSKNFQH